MTKTALKNFFLIASGMMLMTSFGIFALAPQGTSIQANLVNLVQYLGELRITANGTPNSDEFLRIDGGDKTILASSGNYIFDFNSHAIVPFDFIGHIYTDPQDDTFVNGIINNNVPMSLMGGTKENGEQIGISIRDQSDELQAMIEYESTANQDPAIQLQHQIKLKADGAIISFDDHNVLSSQTQLGLGANGFYITASSGGYMAMTRDGTFSLTNYIFPLADGSAGQVIATDGNGQLSWADVSGGSNSIQHDKISISSAALLALNTNPVELIPTPGVGKVIEVLDVTTRYNFNTTAYDTYPNAHIIYSGAGYEVYDSAINLGLIGTTIHHGYIADADMAENDSIILTNTLGNPESGDGTLDIYITYRIIDL